MPEVHKINRTLIFRPRKPEFDENNRWTAEKASSRVQYYYFSETKTTLRSCSKQRNTAEEKHFLSAILYIEIRPTLDGSFLKLSR